ncbi:MAG TPA: SHOCT domain-containing protein [Actinomycetota bacterium]|nr:SHOCT domain-containing protein [Actinomycetota bacterium]
MMGYNNGYGWGAWMLVVMMAWPIVLALGIWAVVALTRDRGTRPGAGLNTPLDILNRRLASGEITEQEYISARSIMNNGESRETHQA